MSTTRKPLHTFGIIVIAGALIASVYVLSYGPAYWCVWVLDNPQLEKMAAIFYWPLDLLVWYGPSEVTDALVKYCDFWYPDS